MKDVTNDLVLDRILNAERNRLWRCWTEPKLLEQWFCPKPWHVTDAVLDLRPGGEFSTVMHGPEGEEFPNTGVCLEVVAGRKLVFTDAFTPGWRPSGRPFMVADVSFEDAGEGRTHYVARAMHWTEEARKEHEAMGFHEGWGKAADQLEDLAKSL
ncbi:SRPBCC family protein [Paracoccus marinaquae]|uniref:SRPBCC family protein n=1 Tax=Paracoccus marinaquae TaxID=2841926 RepID=A0ABS6AD36_9RHOB|nr:SRPBCC family protein [Paracoccus marinaquae]MBU3028514.1 SRPBCC family protein [Paracoccus marinaquae]